MSHSNVWRHSSEIYRTKSKKLNSQKHETMFSLTSNWEGENQTPVVKHSALISEKIQNSERNDYCC